MMRNPVHEKPRPAMLVVTAGTLWIATVATALALSCWFFGAIPSFDGLQVQALLVALVLVNLLPAALEIACKRFDPFDAKHLFYAYYFLIFTFAAFCEIVFDYVRPGLAPTSLDAHTRIRAMATIVLGISMVTYGYYLPPGRIFAQRLPFMTGCALSRVYVTAFAGMAFGMGAFWLLMDSAGGVTAFLTNLGSWRTLGVLSGVGYLTFPIYAILPSCVFLLFVHVLPPRSQRLTGTTLFVGVLALASLVPIMILGFRITLVPIFFQYILVWHYRRGALRLGSVIMLGLLMVVALACYAYLRSSEWEREDGVFGAAVLFRSPGLATVERVVQRMDLQEPHRGIAPALTEAGTILVPRRVWPEKPETAGLIFDDIFFFDYFIGRGDPIDGLKSGISTTAVGEALWIGGLAAVVLGGLLIGLYARTLTEWRSKNGAYPLNLFLYALFVTHLPLFVEAPQNALNTHVMLLAMCSLIVAAVGPSLACQGPLQNRPGHFAP